MILCVCVCVFSSFCLFEDIAFSEYFFVPFPLSLESTVYVLSFRMAFFYLVTTCWIFDISLCENSFFFKMYFISNYYLHQILHCSVGNLVSF